MKEETVRKIQEVLLWRRPAALAILFVLTEITFYLVYAMKLDFGATLMLILIRYNIIKIVMGSLDKVLFAPLPEDKPDQPNRIRTNDEVKEITDKVKEKIAVVTNWLDDYMKNPTNQKHFIFFSIAFIAFALFTMMGSYWVCFIVIHSCLIIPGLYLSSFLQNLIHKDQNKGNVSKDEKVKTE
ncbi:hypothetical protein GPJ56_001162 [Histomonas meleagridis]|uniref:uncharacterized protein n=1 Tax=Histomonas meleagridis TaxID=135588 RepID=UPI0035593942|nr:hypothetical protein GPJ56_001162 [Histomonas meleagridis]KAH0799875.1 hypothetical protein GO595_006987 [Histomonas meleagridis]